MLTLVLSSLTLCRVDENPLPVWSASTPGSLNQQTRLYEMSFPKITNVSLRILLTTGWLHHFSAFKGYYVCHIHRSILFFAHPMVGWLLLYHKICSGHCYLEWIRRIDCSFQDQGCHQWRRKEGRSLDSYLHYLEEMTPLWIYL